MFIRQEKYQGNRPVTVFRLEGDLTDEDQLLHQVEKAVEQGSTHLLLDMEKVGYISSSGLRALHKVYTYLRQGAPAHTDEEVRDGIAAGTYVSSHLKLLKPSKHVREALKVTGYDMFLEIHDDLDKAVESF